MKIGNTPIEEMFLGDTPVKGIWLGSTQVWFGNYRYEIGNIELKYSSGDRLKPDGSNYAYVTCQYSKYKNNVLQGKWSRRMDFDFTSESIGEYFKKNGDGTFSFDVTNFGNKDMSYFSNPFTSSLIPRLNGTAWDRLYFQAEPNLLALSIRFGHNIVIGSATPMKYYSTSISVPVSCYEVFRNTYSSGISELSGEDYSNRRTWYAYDLNDSSGLPVQSGTSRTSITVPANDTPCPILHQYRISPVNTTQEDIENGLAPISIYDKVLSVMQKSSAIYPTGTTQVLFHGGRLLSGENNDVSVNGSDLYICNEVHDDQIIYEFGKGDQNLKVTQSDGIIRVSGISVGTDSWITITTYIPKEKKEWWMDEDPVQDKTVTTIQITGQG